MPDQVDSLRRLILRPQRARPCSTLPEPPEPDSAPWADGGNMRHRRHFAAASLLLTLSAQVYAQDPEATLGGPLRYPVHAAPRTLEEHKTSWLRERSRRDQPEAFASSAARQTARPQRPSQRGKAALLGMAIGGGIGAAIGANLCRADCGGGMPRGALFVGLAGAGIGAGAGLVVALIGEQWP